MTATYYWLGILCMALVTYLTRVLPMTIFRKPIASPFIRSFLSYVPFSALGSMTFPAIFSATGDPLSSLTGTLTALLLAWVRPNLFMVALGAVFVAWLTGQLI